MKLLALPLTPLTTAAMAWTPPPSPNPDEILNEARADRVAGRFDDALAKHLWFHEHALEHVPALYGVRASFAISAWRDLAERHPPAMEAMVSRRDQAERDTLALGDVRRAFGDAAAFNNQLDAPERTVELFRAVEMLRPAEARRLWRMAQDAFVEMGELATVARYIEATREIDEAIESRRFMAARKHPEAPGFDPQALMARMYAERAARAVAVLAIAGRRDEAMNAAAKAREAYPDVGEAVDRALRGEMPRPAFSRADRAAYRKVAR